MCFSELDVCNMIDKAPTVSAEAKGDLISREDALTALNGSSSTWEDDSKVADIINGLPSAKPTGDLISRADAIEAVRGCKFHAIKGSLQTAPWYEAINEVLEILSALPSAEAVSMEEHIKELNDLAIEWKNKYVNAEKRTEEIYDETMAKVANECKECMERLQNLRPSAEAVQGWIPFTRRPMTEEEQKDYPNCTFMFDCVLPDDGDEILVSNGRFVWMDVFCNDIDGCYLDSGDDIDEDMAWMPLPTPYTGGGSE